MSLSQPVALSARYEEEINRRTAAENEFVEVKKVSEKWSRPRIPLCPTEGAEYCYGQGFLLSLHSWEIFEGSCSSLKLTVTNKVISNVN